MWLSASPCTGNGCITAMFLSYRECVAVPRCGIACCGLAPDDTCLELGMSPNEKFREMLKGPPFPCVTHFNGPNPVSSQSFLESKMSFSFSRIKSKIRARAESNGFHHKRANVKKSGVFCLNRWKRGVCLPRCSMQLFPVMSITDL